jgi:hypothetical protein
LKDEHSFSPAFGCYLLALALLPFRWLSPIGTLYEHADWSDVLIGLAAGLWAFEKLRRRELIAAARRWHLPLAIYLLIAGASAAVAVPGRGGGWKTVLLMAELAALAAITADFAADPGKRRTLARVIVTSSIATVALGAAGLLLFYTHVHSGLVGAYGEQFVPSHLYARIQAGFESPPLLASFCIFASGIAASTEAGLSQRARVATQISLGLLCAATFSRGLIGFLLAAALRRSAAMSGRRRVLMAVGAALASLSIIAVLSVGRLHLDPVKPSTISYVVPDPGNRREAFTTSLTTLERHPLFGIGPGALPGINAGSPFRAHFTPLNVAATLGLPALCALLAMLWLVWRDRRRPMDTALWSAAAGISLDGLAQDIDHFRHVWVLIGLLAGGREPQKGDQRRAGGGCGASRAASIRPRAAPASWARSFNATATGMRHQSRAGSPASRARCRGRAM